MSGEFTVVTSKAKRRNDAKAQRATLIDDVFDALGDGGIDGWTASDLTVTHPLAATVRIGQLRNLPTHATVTRSDLTAALGTARGTDASAAFRVALTQVRFHVTAEVADERSGGKQNPRWYSDTRVWAVDPEADVADDLEPGAADLAAAVAEARRLIPRL